MSENPLEPTPDREARIAARAHRLWQEDGSPVGREQEFREQAEFLIGIEDNPDAALLPNPETEPNAPEVTGIEEAAIQENLGEFPDRFTDQGDRRETPMTREELREEEK